MPDHLVLMPMLVPGVGAAALYLAGRTVARRNAQLALLTSLVLAATLGAALLLARQTSLQSQPTWAPAAALGNPAAALGEPAAAPGDPAGAVFRAEPGGVLLIIAAVALGMLVSVFSATYMALDQRYALYYPLLLLLIAGMAGMLLAADIFTMYLFTMLASATGYVLVAFRRLTETAIEAGFKYTIMGATASTLVLVGLGLVYRSSGSLGIPLEGVLVGRLGVLGLALIVAGYGVKGALVPAHTWLPDAHGRAPSSISAMLSGVLIEVNLYVMVKAALGIGWATRSLGILLVVVALVGMTLGNVMAMRQTYGKRLLGYSSIAQVGYIVMALGLGIAYQRVELVAAGLFFLLAHAVLKALAFLCKGACHFYCNVSLVGELDGMMQRMPLAASGLAIALAGLAGIPPLVGFMGKWKVVTGALLELHPLTALALVVFILNSLLSLGYYLPLIARLLKPAEPAAAQAAGIAVPMVPAVEGLGVGTELSPLAASAAAPSAALAEPGAGVGGQDAATLRVATSAWVAAPIVALAALALLFGLWPSLLVGPTVEAATYLLSLGG